MTESITVKVYFRNLYTLKRIPVEIKFFIALSNTSVIMGNDILATRKATIDMHNGILTFKGIPGRIHITCRMPQDMMQPMACVKVVCVVAPQHIALVPIELDGNVSSESYLLEPQSELDVPVMVARSVGWTRSVNNVAEVINPTDFPVLLEPGQPLGTIHQTCERTLSTNHPIASVNRLEPVQEDERENSSPLLMSSTSIRS